MAVALLLPPLKAKTRFDTGSYSIASGLRAASSIRVTTASDARSNTVTVESRPSLTKPRPRSGASATPCAPGVFGMSPTTLSLFTSSTCTWVPCVTNSRWVAGSTASASQPPRSPSRI